MELKELYIGKVDGVPRGIFASHEAMPNRMQQEFEKIIVDEAKWEAGEVYLTNYQEHVIKNKELFTRDEVRNLLIDMYMDTAGAYNDYDKPANSYREPAITEVDILMSKI